MSFSRRNFLGGSAALGLLSAALADTEVADALRDPTSTSSEPTFGQKYWSSLYAGNTAKTRAASRHMTPEERIPAIYHFSDKTQLRRSEEIKNPEELPDFQDEAVVTIELTGYRPGSADQEALSKVNFANMHLSCQRVSGSQFIGPLAWATIATVFTQRTKTLPAVTALDWNTLSGQNPTSTAKTGASSTNTTNPRIQHLLLSHGAGHLNVNVTTTPKESPLDRVLKIAVATSKVIAPLFGFPAISALALEAFYDFYGKLEAAKQDNFLLTTTQKDVIVAKPGLKVTDMDFHPMFLLNGDYILVPLIHQRDFENKMSNLTLVNGFVVEKSANGILADRVKSAIPDVSYLALSVKVQSASDVPNKFGITDPVLSDQPIAGSKPGLKSEGNKQSQPNP
ncbi:MAG TPA: hypothetical protein VKF63_10505 [Terracidiphilus sp.]|nr:hypothetical protein [Terracidiphilus sp.]